MRLNLDRLWYQKHPFRWVLWPFSLIYQFCTAVRRIFIRQFYQQQFPVPIIVVGNLTVGGVGKTPLVITLAKHFTEKGLSVGIVSRGFGAKGLSFPHEVSLKDQANIVGDEPLLIAEKTGCPTVIAPKRTDAVRYLLEKHPIQLIISDDGLQHYAMGRAIEIVVIDGLRQLGNGLCLPAGPLRETSKRLRQSDFIIVNGSKGNDKRLSKPTAEKFNTYIMELTPGKLTKLLTNQVVNHKKLTSIAAVAGIGHPQRFFNTLTHLGISFTPYAFPDHYRFKPQELIFKEKSIIMTEKDAVKCRPFASDSWYFLPVEATLSDSFWQALWSHPQLRGYV